MIEYVLGFVIIGDDEILLQEKNRGPSFMVGKLNGLGGKVEPHEHELTAMRREYYEETGDSRYMDFKLCIKLFYDNCIINVFKCNVEKDFYDYVIFDPIEDENPEKLYITKLSAIGRYDCIYNLSHIVNLILDK